VTAADRHDHPDRLWRREVHVAGDRGQRDIGDRSDEDGMLTAMLPRAWAMARSVGGSRRATAVDGYGFFVHAGLKFASLDMGPL